MTTTACLEIEFGSPPAALRLGPKSVHLWRVCLPDVPDEYSRVLDSEERSRASRFHFDRDRIRFTAAHSALRYILARYLETEAYALHFSTGEYGKPTLPGAPVTFNLSHSGEIMLLAVASGREVGIDVEEVRDNLEFEMLVEQYFPPEDASRIRLLSSTERTAAFFQLWTHTEACLKAEGVGLADDFNVEQRERWEVRNFTPAPGYAAAIAVEGNSFELASWSWPN